MTAAPSATRAIELFSAAQLMAMDLPEPRWAVPDLVAVGLTFLVGKPKLGKSWLALDLCLGIAFGGVVLGTLHVERGDVLYLALEDRKRRLQDRCRRLLQGQKAPDRLTLAVDWPRQEDGGLVALRQWLLAHGEARLVVIDTFAKFRERHDGRNLYAEDYADAGELKSIADEFGCAIVVVHHSRKTDASDVLDVVSGSIGLTGSADSTLILKRERGQADAYLFATGRDIDERELALKWDPTLFNWTVMGPADEYRISKERQEILRTLQEFGTAQTPKQVSEAIGKPTGSVRKLMWIMSHEGQLRFVGSGKYIADGNTGNSGNTGNNGDPGNPRKLGNRGNAVTDSSNVGQLPFVTEVTEVTGVTDVPEVAHVIEVTEVTAHGDFAEDGVEEDLELLKNLFAPGEE